MDRAIKAVALGLVSTTAEAKEYLIEQAAFRAAFFIPYGEIQMKCFLAALVALILSTSLSSAQYAGQTVNVPAAINGTGAITAVFVNTTSSPPAPGTWHSVDVTSLGLPSNTVAINVGGFHVITNGNNSGLSDLTIAFRAYGDTNISCSGNYIGQAISPNPPSGNGMRQIGSYWVRLASAKFEWCYQRGVSGSSFPTGTLAAWPADPAFLINLTLQAWVTP